ncbi:MAG: TIGR04255 family protein [Planctomycetota bacterium]|nr:TIGR04255 family protein [Planctomycetota bacterium]
MAFPDTPRVIYSRNPLAEVVAYLRFPPILRIDSETPAAFQDAIRADYPRYSEGSLKVPLPPNLPPQFMNFVQGMSTGRASGMKHQFASQDEKWQIILTREMLELKTTAYIRWEDFRTRLAQLTVALQAVYRPAAFARIGLRYVNVIQRSVLNLDETPWSVLLKPYIAGELSAPELAEGIDSVSHQLHCRLDDGGNSFLALKTGIAFAEPKKEKCFLIDADIHTHNQTESSDALNVLDSFNRISGRFFRWCIEQPLLNALEPQPVQD